MLDDFKKAYGDGYGDGYGNEDAREVVESIVNYIRGEKYRTPRDDNEHGFNRGIDMAIRNIRDNFL